MHFPESESSTILLPSHFSGEMVAEVARELDKIMLDNPAVTEVVLDFSATVLIASNGVGTLVAFAKELMSRNIRLKLKNLNEELLRFFIDTSLDRVFTIEQEKTVIPAVFDLFETAVDIKMQIGKEFRDDYAVFHLSGAMHHPLESSYFKQQFLLLLTRCNKLILDMNDLEFIDSLSVSSILSMNNLLTGTGGSLLIARPNFFVHDLLDTLSIDAIIPIFSTLEEAYAHWKKKDE